MATTFYYVYILTSENGIHHYVGITQNLEARLSQHNRGHVPHTSKYQPWRVQTAIAFDSEKKASVYERYLKSHAGREYAKRHF